MLPKTTISPHVPAKNLQSAQQTDTNPSNEQKSSSAFPSLGEVKTNLHDRALYASPQAKAPSPTLHAASESLRLSPPGVENPSMTSSTLSREKLVHTAADQLVAKAANIQPKVTDEIRKISAKFGIPLETGPFNLKSRKSIERKLRKLLADMDSPSVVKLFNGVGDALRYQFVLDENHFWKTSNDMVHAFQTSECFTGVKAKECRYEDGYRALHITMSNAGLTVQVKFHTANTARANEKQTEAYNQYLEAEEHLRDCEPDSTEFDTWTQKKQDALQSIQACWQGIDLPPKGDTESVRFSV